MASLEIKITDILSQEEINQIYKDCEDEYNYLNQLVSVLNVSNIDYDI